jgi:hypothetical protein
MPFLQIDRKNFVHLVDTARLVLSKSEDGDARELAEVFLVFAKCAEDPGGPVKD